MNGPLPTWGVVRDHLFRQPLPTGYSLISLGFPLTLSPTTEHLLLEDGFTGTNSSATANLFLIWQADGGGGQAWDTYWYLVGNGFRQWIKSGGNPNTSYNTNPLFPRHRALYINARTTAKPTRAVPCPWLP